MDENLEQLHGQELVEWSKKVHTATKQRIYSAMKQIELEIEANNGIYPSRLSVSEVCRRARVSRATLQKRTHNSSTLPLVAEWLRALGKHTSKKGSHKATASGKRDESYKSRWKAVCQQYHEVELEMIALREQVTILRKELEIVRNGDAKVVALKRDK